MSFLSSTCLERKTTVNEHPSAYYFWNNPGANCSTTFSQSKSLSCKFYIKWQRNNHLHSTIKKNVNWVSCLKIFRFAIQKNLFPDLIITSASKKFHDRSKLSDNQIHQTNWVILHSIRPVRWYHVNLAVLRGTRSVMTMNPINLRIRFDYQISSETVIISESKSHVKVTPSATPREVICKIYLLPLEQIVILKW